MKLMQTKHIIGDAVESNYFLAIRSGRYTLEKRTLDTVEVRSLLVEAKLAPECGKMLTETQREAELMKIVEDLLATEDVAIHKPKSVKQIMEEESKFLVIVNRLHTVMLQI